VSVVETYPRPLREKERDLLHTVLPIDRPGYSRYRDLIASMMVLGDGRRGKGNIVLGFKGDTADIYSPLAPVIAYGMVEATQDNFSITVREYVGDQIDIEIVSAHGHPVGDHFEEKRRWTYSSWLPGQNSPANGAPVREVHIQDGVVLALCKDEKRLWIHNRANGMNILVPITHYYSELMKRKGIRDPKIALDVKRLFTHLDSFKDEELRAAFIAYNEQKPKVTVTASMPPQRKRGWKEFVSKLWGSTV
jgi:hypothetical protein